jgi:transcription termination factor Rho
MASWEAMEMLIDRMKKTKANEEILQQFRNAIRKVGPVVTPDRPPDVRRELSTMST